MQYNFYSNSSHGWLEVSMTELFRLKIAGEITPFSFRYEDTAWLEEDDDMSRFLAAKAALNEPVQLINCNGKPQVPPYTLSEEEQAAASTTTLSIKP